MSKEKKARDVVDKEKGLSLTKEKANYFLYYEMIFLCIFSGYEYIESQTKKGASKKEEMKKRVEDEEERGKTTR